MKKAAALALWTLLLLLASTCCTPHALNPPPAPVSQSCSGTVDCLYEEVFAAVASRYPHLEKPELIPDPLVPNALYRFEQNQVLYWAGFLQTIMDGYGRKAVAGVLAHELGHAVCLNRLSTSAEECADVAAGCILFDMRLSIEPLQEWLRTTEGGGDYPPGEVRALLVEEGRNRCAMQSLVDRLKDE